MPDQAFTIVELSGHIIDSLTLAKVIDTIQSTPCDYQINDIQIGRLKNDFSSVQISLWASTPHQLNLLLKELKPYGANPIDNSETKLEQVQTDGVIPKGAYTRFAPPTQIHYEGEWLPVQHHDGDLVLTLDSINKIARLQPAHTVRKGEFVAMGTQGIRMMPITERTYHVVPQRG